MACTLAGFLGECGHVIAGDVEQALKALRLFVGVNIYSLAVLYQLPFERLRVVDVDNASVQRKEFRKLGSTEAPCSRDDLETFRVGAHGDGLNEAIAADAFAKFVQLGLIEGAAGLVADSWMVSMAMY